MPQSCKLFRLETSDYQKELEVGKNKKDISTTLESYLEEIHSLQLRYGAVRTTDLAEKMGCRVPTATSALSRLAKLGLINYEAYRPVTLSERGVEAIKELDMAQRVLAEFMCEVLAMPEDEAEKEACRLEHRLSARVLQRIKLLMAFMKSDPGRAEQLKARKDKFREFLSITNHK